MFFDPNYWLYMLPAFLIVLAAKLLVDRAYNKWGRVRNLRGLTGVETARRLLQTAQLGGVGLEGVPGHLTDHYDPRTKTLRLSQTVGGGDSVAAMAVAAHEIGHAVQDQQGYLPMRFRSALVPAASVGSNLGWILILIGLALGLTQLAWLGVFAFGLAAVFALATLPVELNASARARALLRSSGLVQGSEEERGINAVLNAAALTYVAALAAAILQLLYWVMLVSGGRRRR
jgi:hypothetical protein